MAAKASDTKLTKAEAEALEKKRAKWRNMSVEDTLKMINNCQAMVESNKDTLKSINSMHNTMQRDLGRMADCTDEIRGHTQRLEERVDIQREQLEKDKIKYEAAEQRRVEAEKLVTNAAAQVTTFIDEKKQGERTNLLLEGLAAADKDAVAIHNTKWFSTTKSPPQRPLDGLDQTGLFAKIAWHLYHHNYVIVDNFEEQSYAASMLSYLQGKHKNGDMLPGQLGKGVLAAASGVDTAMRSDLVHWVPENDPYAADVRRMLARLDTLLQQSVLLISMESGKKEDIGTLLRSRTMGSVYTEGTKYERHIDNVNGNGRRLTTILYLNPELRKYDGGELRMYTPDGNKLIDIEPKHL
eukprot:gene16371-697_t